jgi:2-polyprenyl-6-methoxyphenol hydroxylase-like FAD-dependent oxidoreductase
MRGEVIVVGAGPAGLSAAIGLRQAGVDVTVLEQRSEWPGRVCGGFLNPEGVGHLESLGILNAIAAVGVAVPTARVTTAGGLDRTVDLQVRGTAGLGVTRRSLEETMLELARGTGASVELRVRVVNIRTASDGARVEVRSGHTSGQRRADLVVLADGRFSLAAPRMAKRRHGWFGWNATFTGVQQRPGELSMHFFPFGYFGVLTFADGSSNVCGLTFFGSDAPRPWDERWQGALTRQPQLARLMAGAVRVTEWQGVGPLPFTRAMRPSEGVILAGDAAAVGDPYMGEGISRALGTGPILRRALAGIGDGRVRADAVFTAYREIWARRYAPRLRLGAATRHIMRRPAVFHGLLGLLVPRPRLMRSVARVFHPAPGA